jgi:hypothetical protein
MVPHKSSAQDVWPCGFKFESWRPYEAQPVRPEYGYDSSVAGYSGTPLPRKLGIKPGSRVAFVAPPEDFAATLGELPDGAAVVRFTGEPVDVVVCFVTEPASVDARFLELKPELAWTGGLWMAWPKRTSGIPSGLTENTIREVGLAAGLVDNKVCAIDERWSGLRFVYRLQDRPAKAKQAGSGA